MPEHTPGPWTLSFEDDPVTYRPRCAIVTDPSGEVMHRADLDNCRSKPHAARYAADARLIAAAPDLLAVAEQLAAWTSEHDDIRDVLHVQALAAIAKARGGNTHA